MKLVRMTAVAGVGVLALLACNKREDTSASDRSDNTSTTSNRYENRGTKHYEQSDKSGTTTTTGAHVGSVSYETATSRIVAARCDREAACDNIGAKKRFVDRTVCTHELGAKLADDLKPSECPNGVDGKHLDDCLDSIAKESCGNIVDTISRAGACATSGLCLKADEKPSR